MCPRVSVIMPVYNRAHLISRAIESIRSQTVEAWELIVADDCSTDNIESIIFSYASDSRIQYIKLPENRGAAAARNAGIQLATTEYIAFLDSDDVFHPQFLELSLRTLSGAENKVGFTYTGVGDIRDINKNELSHRIIWNLSSAFQSKAKPYLYDLKIGTAAGITLRKEVFDKAGYFDESLQAAEDTDFFIRLSEHYLGYPIHYVLIFKDNSSVDRLTLNYCKNTDAYRKIIDKNRKEIEADNYLVKRWYYKSMWLHFYAGEKTHARQDFKILVNYGLVTFKMRLLWFLGITLPANYFIKVHKTIAQKITS